MTRTPTILAAALVCGLATAPATAHVTIDREEAEAGSYIRIAFRVPHGCGQSPTTSIRVSIPEGVVAVKPMPKPGWTIDLASAPLARPIELHGRPVTTGVTTVTWSGGSLRNEHFDEFAITAFIAPGLADTDTIRFPVIQGCETGEWRWTEVPPPGTSPHALRAPAPSLRIAAARPSRETRVFGRGPIRVENPWARATPSGARMAAGYVTIANFGDAADRLVGIEWPVATRVELHDTVTRDGVASMREIAGGVEIAPGATISFQPGGRHFMAIGLGQPLREGDVARARLVFEKLGPIDVEIRVRGVGALEEHRH